MNALQLTITDYRDETHWRWQLSDANGRFLADHQVQLDPAAPEYRGLLDLRNWLDFYRPVHPLAEQLKDLGAWIGEQVFGGLARTLLDEAQPPATAVHIHIPAAARALLARPFELARLEGRDGPTLGELGLRLIYHPEGLPDGSRRKDPAEPALASSAASACRTGRTRSICAASATASNGSPASWRRPAAGPSSCG